MDDVDSFRQGGLVFVHRKENADAANNNWWKDGVKYLTEPRTFMRSIQNSGGQNIMQQIDLAQEESLERVAVWTTINPELVAVNYRIVRKASSNVITIDDVDIDEPTNVIDNIQSSSRMPKENRLLQSESIQTPTKNMVSSLYGDKGQSKTIDNHQKQKDLNVNPFLPTRNSQEFPFNSSYTSFGPVKENESVSQETSTNYVSNKQIYAESIPLETQVDNAIYISSEDEDESNAKDPVNTGNIRRIGDGLSVNPHQLKIRDVNEVDGNERVTQQMQCRPMSQLVQKQPRLPKDNKKSLLNYNTTNINQLSDILGWFEIYLKNRRIYQYLTFIEN